MAGQLTLTIYNETESPGTTKIFEAQKLSWANIVDIWDECVKFYEGKYYEIKLDNKTQAEETGIVISSALGTFQYKAEKDPSSFVGNVNYNTGDPITINVTETTEDKKREQIEDGVFEAFIKELCSKITIKVFKKGNSATTIEAANYAESIDETADKAQYTITWDDTKKSDLKQRLTITYSNYSYSEKSNS